MKRGAALVVMLAAPSVLASVDPLVRVQVEPQSVRVGEALSLQVTVLVPTFFPRPPVFPDFEIANAITRLPPDSSYPISERLAGESWSGIIREYEVFPLAAATYRIGDAIMRVTYANPGAAPVVRDVVVPDVVFRATVPDGAGTLDPYLAGSALELTVDVVGNDGALAVGDTVVLTYRAMLTGLPSMFLPPLAAGINDSADALTVYADAPRFADDDGIATRTERVTMVFNAGGEFSIPAVAIDYWNTVAGAVRTARTQPLLFSVAGPPAETTGIDAALDRQQRWPAAFVAAALALAFLMVLFRRRSVVRESLTRWRASEASAFRRLRRELKTRDRDQAYRCVQRWLERLEPGLGPRAFAGTYGDRALRADMEALSAAVFDGRQAEVHLPDLEARLVEARRRYLRRGRASRGTPLAPLNP